MVIEEYRFVCGGKVECLSGQKGNYKKKKGLNVLSFFVYCYLDQNTIKLFYVKRVDRSVLFGESEE